MILSVTDKLNAYTMFEQRMQASVTTRQSEQPELFGQRLIRMRSRLDGAHNSLWWQAGSSLTLVKLACGCEARFNVVLQHTLWSVWIAHEMKVHSQ